MMNDLADKSNKPNDILCIDRSLFLRNGAQTKFTLHN